MAATLHLARGAECRARSAAEPASHGGVHQGGDPVNRKWQAGAGSVGGQPRLKPLEPLQAAWTRHLGRRRFRPSRARAGLGTAERDATVGRDGVKEDPRTAQSLFPQRQENAFAPFDDGPHIGVTLHQRGIAGKYSRHLARAP
jgi:hypothetical protein